MNSFVGRLGFNIGRDINAKTNIYLKANLMHESVAVMMYR